MSIFRGFSDGKQQLIRLLLADRVNESPAARDRGFTEADVRRLGHVELMSTPEATLFSIAEAIERLVDGRGATPSQAIEVIEVQRRSAGSLKDLPDDFFLYGLQRVRLEHPSAQHVDEQHVRACMLSAGYLLSAGLSSSMVLPAFYHGKHKALAVEYAHLVDVVVAYVEGETTDDEFVSASERHTEKRKEFLKRAANKRASVRLQAAINELESDG